jgi:lysophospholipid acyltransferase (LPLAT)-like uncharacterized protein
MRIPAGAAAVAGAALLEALLGRARFEVAGDPAHRAFLGTGRAAIFVLWHGRLLPLAYHYRRRDLATLISQSRDGEIIARIARRWGYTVVRGSSSRGATEALRGIVRCLRSGRSVALTPDGPRGPRERMKPGPLAAARLSGAPLIPVSAGSPHAWWFEGWDRFLVPRPGARVRIVWGEPVSIPADADAAAIEAIGGRLEGALARVTAAADAGGDA